MNPPPVLGSEFPGFGQIINTSPGPYRYPWLDREDRLMPTVPQTPAQHHNAKAERTLALLGSIGATEERRPPARP
jgi:hypothetical protein